MLDHHYHDEALSHYFGNTIFLKDHGPSSAHKSSCAVLKKYSPSDVWEKGSSINGNHADHDSTMNWKDELPFYCNHNYGSCSLDVWPLTNN